MTKTVAALLILLATASSAHASKNISKSLSVSLTLSKTQCKINNGAGVSGHYLLPVISISGQIVGSKNFTTVPIIIDCSAGGNVNQLEITFGDDSNKKIDSTTWSTTNKDLALRFSWTKGKQLGFSLGAVQNINKSSWLEGNKKFNASVDVSPVILRSSVQGGKYTSALPVTVTFI
ncbi:protein fanH [Salmonella enterica subsp. diarizonae]|nr:protein fanH [Salmonella enterica subsp. diarizonae]